MLQSNSIVERFFAKVQITEGCWLWRGAQKGRHYVTRTGYGHFALNGRKQVAAHRWSWIHFHGPIPAGLFVCHTCDNPVCVNPAHLFLGTVKDNALDMVAKGRHGALRLRKTHCLRGHEYTATDVNTTNGRHNCQTCNRQLRRQRYWNRKNNDSSAQKDKTSTV
jgi:hypothetical protein